MELLKDILKEFNIEIVCLQCNNSEDPYPQRHKKILKTPV